MSPSGYVTARVQAQRYFLLKSMSLKEGDYDEHVAELLGRARRAMALPEECPELVL